LPMPVPQWTAHSFLPSIDNAEGSQFAGERV
jgi:hypothetical protein